MRIYNIDLLKNKKLLVVCPSRQRSKLALKMYDSFRKNTTNAGIIFLLDADDIELEKYISIFKNYSDKACFVIGQFKTLTSYINTIINKLNTFEFYSVTNDDFIYHSYGWDLRLTFLAKGGIAYGNDKCRGEDMPTTSVIDANIIQALGWYNMPMLNNLYADNVWKVIGKRLNILRYNPNIIIEHNHFLYNKKVEKDDTYKRTNSRQAYELDDQAFHLWLKHHCDKDCQTIKEALIKCQNKSKT